MQPAKLHAEGTDRQHVGQKPGLRGWRERTTRRRRARRSRVRRRRHGDGGLGGDQECGWQAGHGADGGRFQHGLARRRCVAALEAADTTKVRRRAGRPLVIGGDMVGASATTTRTDSATAIEAQPWSARSLSHWRGAHQGTRPGLQQNIVLHGGEPLEGEEPHTALAERGHHVGDAERGAHVTEAVAVPLV